MQHSARCTVVVVVSAIALSCSRGETKARTDAATSQPVATSGAAEATVAARGGTNANGAAADVDQEAVAALNRMGAYLRTLTAFQVTSDTTRDDVLDDGQRIQFAGHVDMLVQRPNRFRAELTSDRQHRLFFYDGSNFTLWARRANYYATVPAPPTLAELGDRLQTRYGIEMPLADLFYWGAAGHDTAPVTSARRIGPSQIEGVSCDHYAFRQPDVDWQVWIQPGNYPLPRKLVITTTSDSAHPQYVSVMTWNLAPAYNDAAFTFEPPADAQKITFRELPGSSER